MNHAIIVAAGSSTRFSSPTPKQFSLLKGKPLLFHTLERFEAASVIDNVVLVLSAEGVRDFEQVRSGHKFSKLAAVVSGGPSRAESVRNGLNSLAAAASDIVAVHDGARPLVTIDEITRTVDKASETGAVCLAAAVTDTIKEADGGEIFRTLDRSRLLRALTPQAFRYDLLTRAFAAADLDDSVTDECSLVERLGVRIAVVEGSVWNIKITRSEDLRVAEALISSD